MGIREAVSVTGKQRVRYPTPYCVTLYSALKGPTGGECQRDQNKGGSEGRATAHTICVGYRPGRILHANDRRKASNTMPEPIPAQRASAKPFARTLGPVARSGMAGRRWGDRAAESSHPAEPTGRVSG